MDRTVRDLAGLTAWLAELRRVTAIGRAERPEDAPELTPEQKACREAIFVLADKMSELEFGDPAATAQIERMAAATMVLVAIHDGEPLPGAESDGEAANEQSDGQTGAEFERMGVTTRVQ